jgi:hypothetical protein
MALVAGVRCSFRGKNAGSADSRSYGRPRTQPRGEQRCPGIDRVRIHTDLTMLARLGQAVSRVRAVQLAA